MCNTRMNEYETITGTKKTLLVVLGLFILFFTFINSVKADNYYSESTTSAVMTGQAITFDYVFGAIINITCNISTCNPAYHIRLRNVTIMSGANATRFIVYNSLGTVQLKQINVTLGTSVVDMNYDLGLISSVNNTYFRVGWLNKDGLIKVNQTALLSKTTGFAINNISRVYARCFDTPTNLGTCSQEEVGSNTYFTNLLTYQLEIETPVLPVFINQTPSDISSSNVINNPLTIYYDISIPQINYSYINYSFVGGSIIINGTTQNVYQQINSTSNTTNIFKYVLDDNEVYPAVYLVPEETVENTQHYNITLTNNNEYYRVNLIGINSSKQNSLLEADLAVSGNSFIYYCNSSYTNGILTSTPFCSIFASINNLSYAHTHNYSKHNTFSMPIINGTLAGITVTSNSSFVIGKSSGTAYIEYINGSVPRSNSVERSINIGQVWNNYANLIDLHVHQFSNSDAFKFQSCAVIIGSSTECSGFVTDTYDITPLPPTAITVTINSTNNYYNDVLRISRTNSSGFNNVTIIYYNYSIVDENNNYVLNINPKTNLSIINFTVINIKPSNYFIRITATDNNTQSSNSFSVLFNVQSRLISPCNITVTSNSSGIPIFFNWTTDNTIITTMIRGKYQNITFRNLNDTTGNRTISGLQDGIYYLYFNQTTNDSSNVQYDSGCLLGVCVNNWVSVPQQCISNLKQVIYTDSHLCSEKYDVPSDNGSFVDCQLPPNTDKELWLVLILVMLFIVLLVMTIIYPLASIGLLIVSIFTTIQFLSYMTDAPVIVGLLFPIVAIITGGFSIILRNKNN